jgi:hypothetical protein
MIINRNKDDSLIGILLYIGAIGIFHLTDLAAEMTL